MNGKVSGLPMAVPRAEARMLPPNATAIAAAMMKWKPMKGVNEAKAPAATPTAIVCGLAEIRVTRCHT